MFLKCFCFIIRLRKIFRLILFIWRLLFYFINNIFSIFFLVFYILRFTFIYVIFCLLNNIFGFTFSSVIFRLLNNIFSFNISYIISSLLNIRYIIFSFILLNVRSIIFILRFYPSCVIFRLYFLSIILNLFSSIFRNIIINNAFSDSFLIFSIRRIILNF